LLQDARRLRDRARVHLHAYTSQTVAEVVLHTGKELSPGTEALAQLRLANPTLLVPGDRFIIRQFSPVVTIGGGVVLDATPIKQPPDKLREFLRVIAGGNPEEILAARVMRRGAPGLTLRAAVAETGRLRVDCERTAAALVARKAVVPCGDVLIATEHFNQSAQAALEVVKAFHEANPLVAGMSKEELRERLELPEAIFTALLGKLEGEKKLESNGEQVRLAGRVIVMKQDEAQSKQTIERAFADAGLKVPALKEVLGSLKIDRERAHRIVTLLLRDKVLVKLTEDLVFHQHALDALRKSVVSYKTRSPKLDVAAFKDLTGVSRKYAIPLLEYLDRERVTRRVGDERVIL
jgi:selenocysteine-specific elongation factor